MTISTVGISQLRNAPPRLADFIERENTRVLRLADACAAGITTALHSGAQRGRESWFAVHDLYLYAAGPRGVAMRDDCFVFPAFCEACAFAIALRLAYVDAYQDINAGLFGAERKKFVEVYGLPEAAAVAEHAQRMCYKVEDTAISAAFTRKLSELRALDAVLAPVPECFPQSECGALAGCDYDPNRKIRS